MLTLKTSLKPPLPSKCNSRYRSFSVGWSLNLRDKMVSSWLAICLCLWTCMTYTAVGWCVLRVVFIVDSLQFPNVQVSDALQVLKFCLDLCFLLQESNINCNIPPPSVTVTTAGQILSVTTTAAWVGELVPFSDDQFEVWKSPLAHDILPVTTCMRESSNRLYSAL